MLITWLLLVAVEVVVMEVEVVLVVLEQAQG
jgi:hypothetical protein